VSQRVGQFDTQGQIPAQSPAGSVQDSHADLVGRAALRLVRRFQTHLVNRMGKDCDQLAARGIEREREISLIVVPCVGDRPALPATSLVPWYWLHRLTLQERSVVSVQRRSLVSARARSLVSVLG